LSTTITNVDTLYDIWGFRLFSMFHIIIAFICQVNLGQGFESFSFIDFLWYLNKLFVFQIQELLFLLFNIYLRMIVYRRSCCHKIWGSFLVSLVRTNLTMILCCIFLRLVERPLLKGKNILLLNSYWWSSSPFSCCDISYPSFPRLYFYCLIFFLSGFCLE
jgi:hypothetical protein